MDETYIGGAEPGLAGGRAKGKKVLTGIAVEVQEPKGLGRCRISPLADASAESLHAFVMDHVEPAPRSSPMVGRPIKDWRNSATCTISADRALGDDPNKLLPAVHRVASLAKRWLLGTPPGLRRRRPPGQLSRRVRPLQPLPQPRHGVLSRARTGGRSRTDALSGFHRQPASPQSATRTTDPTRTPRELGTSGGEPAVAGVQRANEFRAYGDAAKTWVNTA